MIHAIRILKIQRLRLARVIGQTSDPDLLHELLMLQNENAGALTHLEQPAPAREVIRVSDQPSADVELRVRRALAGT